MVGAGATGCEIAPEGDSTYVTLEEMQRSAHPALAGGKNSETVYVPFEGQAGPRPPGYFPTIACNPSASPS